MTTNVLVNIDEPVKSRPMIFKPHHIGIQTYDMHHIVWLKIEIWTFYETINIRAANILVL